MKRAQYKKMFFPEQNLWICMAWNYNQAVLISTHTHANALDAMHELQATCKELNVELSMYAGTHHYDSELGEWNEKD